MEAAVAWPVAGWRVFAAGLVGGVLLAASSVAAGHPAVAVPGWLAGTVSLAGAWLALGRRLTADPAGGTPAPPRVGTVLATGLPWAVPLLVVPPLASRDAYSYACQGALVGHGLDPYTHGVDSLPCAWLSSVPQLWWHTPAPYGPLWLALSGAAAATGQLVLALTVLRLVALAGLAVVGWAGHRMLTALATGGAGNRATRARTRADPVAARTPPAPSGSAARLDAAQAARLDAAQAARLDAAQAAWLALLSPLVLVHAVSGMHNDALLAGLVLAGLAVAVRYRGAVLAALPVGVLFALVAGVKATGLVALPFAVLAVAGDRRWRVVLRCAGLALAGLAGGYAALWAATGYGLGWLAALSGTAGLVQWTSPPTAVGMSIGYLLRPLGLAGASPAVLAAVRALALALLATLLVVLWCRARARLPSGSGAGAPKLRTDASGATRGVVLAAGLGLAGATLLAPVAFPWYALTPLAVLGYGCAGWRARYRLGVFAAGCALLVLPDGTGLAALTKLPGALAVTATVAVVAGTAVRALRRRRAAATAPATPRPTAR